MKGKISIHHDPISVPGGRIVSVENLTTYHDTKESQGAMIYLGGLLNTVRTNLLKKLYIFDSDIIIGA